MRVLVSAVIGLSLLLLPGAPVADAALPPFMLQMGVGGIEGKIMGGLQPVNGAEVTLMQKDKVIDKTETDTNGHYAFTYINPGKYDIKASKTGYRTSIIIKIQVSSDNTTKNDLYLPKFNNEHMLNNPHVETYEENYSRYIRHTPGPGRRN